MNNYYVDPSVETGGSGTIESPYNKIKSVIDAGVSHPCTIWVKRGTVLTESVDLKSVMDNQSGQLSYIRPYGNGYGRKPKWQKPNISSVHLTCTSVRNFIITGFSFFVDDDTVSPNNGGSFINLVINNTTQQDIDANVWVCDCIFKAGALTRSGIYGGNKTVYIVARGTNTNRVNKFGVTDSKFKNLSRGVQLQGIDKADDNTDNRTGTYYSRGAQVRRCSFVGMSNGAVCLVCIESENSAYTSNDNQSGAFNCTYSSYRWDRYDGTTIRPDAVFWTYHCNRVMFEKLSGGGMQPTEADSEFIDFDGLSWDCVARYICSHNNGAGSLWISTAVQARASFSDYSSQYTEYEWYYTRRNGSGNNVIEYSLFYNDGNQRSDVNPAMGCAFHRITTFSYNCIIRKTVHINMSAMKNQYIAQNTLLGSGSTLVTFEDCIFIWKFLTSTDIFSGNAFTSDKLSFKNCCVYSLSWDSTMLASVKSLIESISNNSGMIYSNPRFVSLPTQSFVSIESAMNLLLKPDSPCIGTGTTIGSVDINGKTSNDIFWRSI